MPYIYDLTRLYFHERSYNENSTPSRPLWEVKSHLAWSVVRWVTTCEARVLFVFSLSFWSQFILFIFYYTIILSLLIYPFYLFFSSLFSCFFFSFLLCLLRESNLQPPGPSYVLECGLSQCPMIRERADLEWERKWNPSKYETIDYYHNTLYTITTFIIILIESRERARENNLSNSFFTPLSFSLSISSQYLFRYLSDIRILRNTTSIYMIKRESSNGFLGLSHICNLNALQDYSLRFWSILWRKRGRKVDRMIKLC